MSVIVRRRLGAGWFLYGLCGVLATANAAPPCAGDAPAMELRIVAAALAPDTDRNLVARVFDDGCVQVHRPAFRRDAADFRVDLDATALQALRGRVDQPALHSFDAKRVQAELVQAQRQRATQDGRERRDSELDADRYEIVLYSGSKRSAVAWAGVPASAGCYPDDVSRQAFHNAATALQQLAERGNARAVDGGRP